MATYNGERYVRAQIESILAQLSGDDEIVVQDDCSSDDTLRLLEGLADPRIMIARNAEHSGVIRTVELALRRAMGEFVFLADQDDVWLPGRVERALRLHDEFDLVVVNCRVVDEALRTVAGDFFAVKGSGPGILRNLYRNSFLGCCMSFKRRLLEKVLPFPRPIPMHDMWIGMVATLWGSVCFHEEPLVLYRRHADVATLTATDRPARPLRVRLMDRLQLVAGILGRLSRSVASRFG